jgi:hypothetical protein
MLAIDSAVSYQLSCSRWICGGSGGGSQHADGRA